jgi:hypothetical protein
MTSATPDEDPDSRNAAMHQSAPRDPGGPAATEARLKAILSSILELLEEYEAVTKRRVAKIEYGEGGLDIHTTDAEPPDPKQRD